MSRILIAEDEDRIASFLEKGLRAAGYVTTRARDGEDAASLARDADFDLLILDLGLPFMDGQAVIREVRRRGQRLPIVVLTARQSLADTVAGLDGGADDYLTKPFRFEELLARVRVRLRQPGGSEPVVLRNGAIEVNVQTRQVTAAGAPVELSAREYMLAETFLRHVGQVLSREQLLSHVWGFDFDPGSNVVDVFIGHLRKKLGADFIETVRGMGYRCTLR